MHPTPHDRRRAGLAAILLAVGGLAACESDGDDLSAEACDAYVAAQGSFFGDPTQIGPAFDALAAALDGEAADDAAVVAAAAGSDDPAAFESPEVTAASERLGDTVFDGCDTVEAVDVEGVDYAFGDLPDELEAGRMAFRIENESATDQPHELVIVTSTDGRSAEELRDLPMEELMAVARPVAVAFAATPGTSATTLVDLQPGSYLVICSLPVAEDGAQPDPSAPPTDTHADHGMVDTLTVV